MIVRYHLIKKQTYLPRNTYITHAPKFGVNTYVNTANIATMSVYSTPRGELPVSTDLRSLFAKRDEERDATMLSADVPRVRDRAEAEKLTQRASQSGRESLGGGRRQGAQESTYLRAARRIPRARSRPCRHPATRRARPPAMGPQTPPLLPLLPPLQGARLCRA